MFPTVFSMGLYCIIFFILSLLYISVSKLSKDKSARMRQVLKAPYFITVLYMLILITTIILDIFLGINIPHWIKTNFSGFMSYAFAISNISLFLYWIYEKTRL